MKYIMTFLRPVLKAWYSNTETGKVAIQYYTGCYICVILNLGDPVYCNKHCAHFFQSIWIYWGIMSSKTWKRTTMATYRECVDRKTRHSYQRC
eukprot:m.182797 g.182797  ORF g.182797 m.182797 type:complete len:93 (+) comp15536_c0_seq6:2235-2513(+)